jgi:hypothetical protein
MYQGARILLDSEDLVFLFKVMAQDLIPFKAAPKDAQYFIPMKVIPKDVALFRLIRTFKNKIKNNYKLFLTMQLYSYVTIY